MNEDIVSTRRGRILKYLLVVFLAVTVLVLTGIIGYRCANYELHHAYRGDTVLFWTVGRGMLNGISPYSGLYENKPPAIFLLSAISFLLTDDTILCNIFSLICLFVIAFTPLACYTEKFYSVKPEAKDRMLRLVPGGIIILVSGLLLSLYCEERGGGYQPEICGTAFSALYFWAIGHIDYSTLKELKQPKQLKWTLLAAVFAMCGVMFKEPFVLLMISGSFLMMDKPFQFVSRLLVPMLAGGVICVAVMAATGVFTPYFTIYISNMFANHISRYGSPLVRGLRIDYIVHPLYTYSRELMYTIVVGVAVVFLTGILKAKRACSAAWIIFRLAFAFYCASFAVGLGGQYYDHHYIFAAPLFVLILIQLGQWTAERTANAEADVLTLSISIISMTFLLRFYQVNFFLGDCSEIYQRASINADYVDELMDTLGEERYQFLGFNGERQFYGLTTHSPMGPSFVQDPYLYEDEGGWFCQQLLSQLNSVNIVIFDQYKIPAIEDEVKAILFEDFTTEAPQAVSEIEIPDGFDYTVYYRTEAYK